MNDPYQVGQEGGIDLTCFHEENFDAVAWVKNQLTTKKMKEGSIQQYVPTLQSLNIHLQLYYEENQDVIDKECVSKLTNSHQDVINSLIEDLKALKEK